MVEVVPCVQALTINQPSVGKIIIVGCILIKRFNKFVNQRQTSYDEVTDCNGLKSKCIIIIIVIKLKRKIVAERKGLVDRKF